MTRLLLLYGHAIFVRRDNASFAVAAAAAAAADPLPDSPGWAEQLRTVTYVKAATRLRSYRVQFSSLTDEDRCVAPTFDLAVWKE